MMKAGDKVRVIRVAEGCEDWGYAVGDIHTVERVHDQDYHEEPIIDVVDGDFDLYFSEVELVDEDAEYAAKDADVTQWVKEEHIDEYNEIVVSLSQAIADKAAQMRKEDEEKEEEEQPEVFGILQEGISEEQAIAAMKRAKRSVRLREAEKARERMESLEAEMAAAKEALRKADEALAEYDEEMVAEDTEAIAKYMGDKEWDEMEDVGREVIYDAYNPDVVKAPAHYVNSGIEPIQYMADKLPAYDDGHTAFCVGNVIKYVSRAPHKGKLVEDLKKARQYLDFAIEHEEKK